MNFIKNNPFKTFFALSFFILIVSLVVRIYMPQRIPKEALIEGGRSPKASYTFDYSRPQKPTKLSVFSSPTTTFDADLLANNLATDLNLSPMIKLKNYWANSAKTEVLRIRTDNIISYRETPAPTQASNTPNSARATQQVKNFLEKLKIFDLNILKLSPPKMVNVSERGIFEVENKEEAHSYQIALDFKFDDIPFILDTYKQPPALAYTELNGDLQKVNFYPINTKFENAGEYKTLDWKSIEENIKNNRGTFIKIEKQDPFAPSLEIDNIQVIEINQATLEYRQNKNNSYVLPYVLFDGVGKTAQNNNYDIKIIVPIIEVEF